VGDRLARTAKDALHVRGNRSSASFSGSQAAYAHVAKGADNYDRSFDSDD
jgi:hypothetical protein